MLAKSKPPVKPPVSPATSPKAPSPAKQPVPAKKEPTKSAEDRESFLSFMKKKQEDRRFIKSLEVGFTFILISLLSIFAIRPAIITITNLTGEIKAKKLLNQKLDSKLRKIIEAQNNFAQIQDYYEIIEKTFPSSPQYSHATNQIQSASQVSNLSLDKITFNFPKEDTKQNTPTTDIQQYSINSSIQTDFYPAVDFLNKITQNRRLIDITSVSMNIAKRRSSSSEKETPSQINFNFNTNVYYWKK
jgi:hypothetical protein